MPLWDAGLRRIDHRLIWWMLEDMREDGLLAAGWRGRARRSLRQCQSVISESSERLRAAGVIRFHRYQRAAWVLGEAFEKDVARGD